MARELTADLHAVDLVAELVQLGQHDLLEQPGAHGDAEADQQDRHGHAVQAHAGCLHVITLLEVVLGPLWVWIFLSEQPGAATLVGGAIVLGAVALQTRGAPGEEPQPLSGP